MTRPHHEPATVGKCAATVDVGLLTALVGIALTFACGNHSEANGAGGDTPAGAGGMSSSPGDEPGNAGSSSGGLPALLPLGGAPATNEPVEPNGPDPSPSSPADPADPNAPRFFHYIQSGNYPRLELEIDAVDGLAPSVEVSEPLLGVLRNTLDKPEGIELRSGNSLEARGSDYVWTFAELAAAAEASFDEPEQGNTIAIHVMFVDGHYELDDDTRKILGLAWDHRQIAIFKDTILRGCGASGPLGVLEPAACQKAESAIWLHEVGHVLGLVDNGLPMVVNHRDPDPAHGPHDADPNCVMYFAYDGDAVFDALVGGLLGSDGELGYCQTSIDDINAAK